MPKHSVIVRLHIDAEEFLRYYRGSAKVVSAPDIYGRSVRFPANILQPFITREGIQGVFEIFFDESGKFVSIEKM